MTLLLMQQPVSSDCCTSRKKLANQNPPIERLNKTHIFQYDKNHLPRRLKNRNHQ
jgi:hypothetical protein